MSTPRLKIEKKNKCANWLLCHHATCLKYPIVCVPSITKNILKLHARGRNGEFRHFYYNSVPVQIVSNQKANRMFVEI